MSGNEPNWKDDEQELPSEEESRNLYGAPKGPDGPLWEPDAADSEDASEPIEISLDDPAPVAFDEPEPLEQPTALDLDADPGDAGGQDEAYQVSLGSDGADSAAAPDFESSSFEPSEFETAEPQGSEPELYTADDAPGLQLAGESGADEDLDLGNRPADGARVVAASEVFSEEFMGTEGASDFLGLDTEFDSTPAGPVAPIPVTPATDDGELDLAAAPALATEVATEAAPLGSPELGEEDEYLAEVDGSYVEGEYEGDAYAEDELEGEYDEFEGEEVATGSSRSPMLLVAGAFVLGLGAVALTVAGPRFFPRFFGKQDAPPAEVAQVTPQPKPKPKPVATDPEASDPAGQGEAGTEAGGEAGVEAGGTEPVEGSGGGLEPRPVEEFVDPAGEDVPPAFEDPGGAVVEGPVTVDPEAAGDPLVEADPIEATPEVSPDDPVYQRGDATGPTTLEDLVIQVGDADTFLGGNAELIDLVWRGTTVPFEAVASPNRILTPAVGRVRVEMVTSDVFEGRLFAVGENKVWLDLDLGRIGLDGRGVEGIQNLEEDAPGKGGGLSDIATGRRVRARVPGGVLYGRVRTIRGDQVTLVTDSGARITLDAPDLEPVSEQKSVVLKF